MGSVAKFLGQLSARSLETRGAKILRTTTANKVPGSLALALDGTLREGHHNMRVFGLGTAATMANLTRYARFTSAMLHVYSTMETELDRTSQQQARQLLEKYHPSSEQEAPQVSHGVVGQVWERDGHREVLQRAPALTQDLEDALALLRQERRPAMSEATHAYVRAIEEAGARDREEGTARLLGHLYCRYFADLFGGQMLGHPTQLALALPSTPRHYVFAFQDSQTDRGLYIESLYRSLNAAGNEMSAQGRAAVVEETRVAFQRNVEVYSEDGLVVDAMRGAANVGWGYLKGLVARGE